MQIHWVISSTGRERANNLGYGSANKRLELAVKELCEKKGIGFSTESGDVAIHFCNPLFYIPKPHAKNILVTMFEAEDVPYHFPLAFEGCDLIVTPSSFCRDIFRKVTDKPIEVCHLGVDTNRFQYKKREWHPELRETFKWCFVGAPNSRKYSIMEQIFVYLLKNEKIPFKSHLYIKTTGVDLDKALVDLEGTGRDFRVNGEIVHGEDFTFDNRYISETEVVKILHSSHAFFALHLGEGWGQNALEALATGLPVLVTDYSATQVFCNERNSYPVKSELQQTEAIMGKTDADADLIHIRTGHPSLTDGIEKAASIMFNYKEALKRARRGAEDAKKFSWENSAKRMIEIIQNLDSSAI